MTNKQPYDSTGIPIYVGDRIKFRCQIYTIRDFIPQAGLLGTNQILLKEKCHTQEVPDEISVDLVGCYEIAKNIPSAKNG